MSISVSDIVADKKHSTIVVNDEMKVCDKSTDIVYWRQIQNAAMRASDAIHERRSKDLISLQKFICECILFFEVFIFGLAALSKEFGTTHFYILVGFVLTASLHTFIISIAFRIVGVCGRHRCGGSPSREDITDISRDSGCRLASQLFALRSGHLTDDELTKLFSRRSLLRRLSDIDEHAGTNLLDAVFSVKKRDSDDCTCGNPRCKYENDDECC